MENFENVVFSFGCRINIPHIFSWMKQVVVGDNAYNLFGNAFDTHLQ